MFGIACGDINGGLRTTLIIAVGYPDKLHYGYVVMWRLAVRSNESGPILGPAEVP